MTRGDGTRWGVVAFGLALAFLAALQQYKLPPVLPVLLDRYAYDAFVAGGFMGVYALLGLLFSVELGRLLDRFGLAPVLAACACFAVGGLVTLAAPESGLVVLAARTVEGMGFALMAVAGPALANRAAGPRQIALVAGLTAAWIPVGQVVGNAIALPFVDAGVWQAVWWAALAATAAVALWALRLRRLGVGAAAAGGAAPEVPPTPRERRALLLASGVFLLWSGQYIGFTTWINEYLVETAGLGAAAAALVATIPPALVIALNVVTGFALRAGWPIAPLFVGSILVEVAIWLAAPHVGGAAGLALLVLYGAACGVTPVCLFAMPMTVMGRERVSARSFGILMRGRSTGVFLGPLLLPAALAHLGGWGAVWPLYAAVTLAAAAGAALVMRALRAPA